LLFQHQQVQKDKAKPVARRGRKATGPETDSRAALLTGVVRLFSDLEILAFKEFREGTYPRFLGIVFENLTRLPWLASSNEKPPDNSPWQGT
jgi:hypothetical protein